MLARCAACVFGRFRVAVWITVCSVVLWCEWLVFVLDDGLCWALRDAMVCNGGRILVHCVKGRCLGTHYLVG